MQVASVAMLAEVASIPRSRKHLVCTMKANKANNAMKTNTAMKAKEATNRLLPETKVAKKFWSTSWVRLTTRGHWQKSSEPATMSRRSGMQSCVTMSRSSRRSWPSRRSRP